MGIKNLFDREAFVKALEDSGHTVNGIAEMIECQPNDIYRYMRGQNTPRLKRLKQLVDILGPSITGLKVSSNNDESFRFNEDERRHLNWFRSLPVYRQARMLGAYTAVYEFGNTADAEFAADLSEQLIAEEERKKEQPG